ncbi:quinol monooxygenase YgiN [Pseudomonas sp. TE6349]
MSEHQHLMVTFKSKPGHEADLKNVLLELVKASRAESDCIRYDLSQSAADSELFFLVECWASEKSLREHQQTPHFYEGIKKIEALAAHTDVHFIHWLEPGQ